MQNKIEKKELISDIVNINPVSVLIRTKRILYHCCFKGERLMLICRQKHLAKTKEKLAYHDDY